MYVARRGQSAGQRFYKCRNHNPGAGGCDFYRWQEAYAAHLGVVLPAAEPGDQIQAAVDQPQAQINQPPVHQPLQNHGPRVEDVAAVMNQVVASLMGIVDGARQKGVFVADAASINIGMSVAIFIICVCNLVLLVAVILMRAQE
ncbi:hypothetical protein VPH35_003965 [Triticum aestivum]